uniref:Uncharacterized protein n=2 Tax=viral metagenome TaxID=1070528 RepID=A0A6H1ZFY3_9ZZZZ
MTAAIDLVPLSVRAWLIEHGPRVGRLARLGDGASTVLVSAFAHLQAVDEEDVPAAVRRVEQCIETWETIWGDE